VENGIWEEKSKDRQTQGLGDWKRNDAVKEKNYLREGEKEKEGIQPASSRKIV